MFQLLNVFRVRLAITWIWALICARNAAKTRLLALTKLHVLNAVLELSLLRTKQDVKATVSFIPSQ